MLRSIWLGFDPREVDAYAVARHSVQRHCISPIPQRSLVLRDLMRKGLYTRPTERRVEDGGRTYLYDAISQHAMSTEFAISRFLVPTLARQMFGSYPGNRKDPCWALFMDADMLVRGSLDPLFKLADPRYAVMVVKHDYKPTNTIKMDGQVQSLYNRKNWSSVMLFNCDHPANAALTPELINTLPGRDLHRFCWLADEEIGELDPKWNFLVGHHNKDEIDPVIVHFTEGVPSMAGYENSDFAEEWWDSLERWALHRK